MQSRFSQALIHALKVGMHILISVVIVGLAAYVTNHSAEMQAFSSWLVSFGIPAGIVNMAVAAGIKYVQSKATSDVTIDSLPDDQA